VSLVHPKPSRQAEPFHGATAPPLVAAVPADGGRLRRCTFRYIAPGDQRSRSGGSAYQVACLFPERENPLPLGDMTSARAICGACAATGIFRADED
jgi:hypothetical protein